MIRGIGLKIFLWFLFATLLTTAAVFLITVATHSQALGPSWMIGVLDQYTRSAVNIYEHGGKARLAEYLDEIHDASFLQSTLLDSQNRDILGRGVPPGAPCHHRRTPAGPCRPIARGRFRSLPARR